MRTIGNNLPPFLSFAHRCVSEFGPALQVPQYTPQSPPKIPIGECVPVYKYLMDEPDFPARADHTGEKAVRLLDVPPGEHLGAVFFISGSPR